MAVTFSRRGYVKRVPLETYRAQGRGGRGVKGSEAKDGDVLRAIFAAGTHDHLLFFSNRGQVYWQKVYQLPEGSRTSQGRAIRNLLPLQEDEIITDVLRVRSFDSDSLVMFATRRGIVKKTVLEAYSRPKKSGIRAIVLDEGDEVVGVGLCEPGDTVLLCTSKGQAIRFDEKAARAMGRTSRGVRGIKLRADDRVVGLIVASGDGATVVTACEQGYGKRTPLDEYPIKGRGGQGVINIRAVGRNGEVVAAKLARDPDDVMFITANGMIVRSPAGEMRPMGRATQGTRLVSLKAGDRLVGIEIVSAEDLEAYAGESDESDAPAAGSVEASSNGDPAPAEPGGDGEVDGGEDTPEEER